MTAAKVVVTGAHGFIGKNLTLRLNELESWDVRPIGAGAPDARLRAAVSDADMVVHLAGVNRPKHPSEYMKGNRDTVSDLIAAIEATGRRIPVILTSSTQAEGDTPYGLSKKAAEQALFSFGDRTGNPAYIFRLANVFGKWCRPNYNSVIATFCHNVARGLPITVNDECAGLSLVYIDDVVGAIVDVMMAAPQRQGYFEVSPIYQTTVGEVAELIRRFRTDRQEGFVETVGVGLVRALYATYVASTPPAQFSYPLVAHTDERGAFSEVLKTRTSGQFSFFTALPGATRGGHYHHTKTEKFLVVKGDALFRFRHVVTGEVCEIRTSNASPVIVETVPGWAHDITNVGEDTLISLLWANETFDPEHADTISMKP
jgi:UDP-2-acetamido-2,6-beta-L-arabino-hexul-4-ose reductase